MSWRSGDDASHVTCRQRIGSCVGTDCQTYGNHGRTTKRRRISTGYKHSWEWLAYNNLAGYFKTPKIRFKIEQGYHNWLDVQGHDVRFHHGDAIRYHGGIGGVTIPLRKKIAQWNKRRHSHLDILGHFHQFIDAWDYVVCGCLGL
ncbi:MAG: hypothetical protein ACC628_02825 [Pirellulaceae bacterium]